MTAEAFWNKWLLYFVCYAVMLPLTVYHLFHNWGEWLFLTALGLAWFSITYRLVRDIRALHRGPAGAQHGDSAGAFGDRP